MSDPKQVHIQGDVNISAAPDTANEGFGSLYISNASALLDVEGETFLDKTNIDTTDGLLSVTGSNKVSMNVTSSIEMDADATSWLKTSVGNLALETTAGVLDMDGSSVTLNSNTTTVGIVGATGVSVTSSANNVTVTASADFDVNASAAITMDAAAASHLTTSAGNLTLESTSGRAILNGLGGASNAVTVNATGTGGMDVNIGSSGLELDTTAGYSIDGVTASNISLATLVDAQDLTISVTGATNSSLIFSSTGTAADAIKITSSATTGGLDIDTGTGGVIVDTTGSVSLDGAAASNFTTSSGDLTNQATTGSVNIIAGEAAADAIRMNTTNAAGGIDIDAGTAGIAADTTGSVSLQGATASDFTVTGATDLTLTTTNTGGRTVLSSAGTGLDAVRIHATAGGLDVNTASTIDIETAAGFSIDGANNASNISLSTNGAAQDLTISVTGVQNSSLILSSTGTSSTDAIIVSATAGGIDLDAVGQINLDTTDTVNGIFIATNTSGVPVTIGTAASQTTIAGNLTVSGTTTTINAETLSVEDNIIFVNSANGELGADGGMVVRRYQTANNTGTGGDVVLDTGAGVVTGAFQAGSATPGTLKLDTSASAVNDYYNGWWIKITSGAGNNQIRRIKGYVGATKTATLYVTADNTGGFTDGLNLVTAPAATNTYSLFNSPMVASFYDESADKWTLAFTSLNPDPVPNAGTSTVIIQRYASFDSGSITIQDNGTPANSTLNVNYINEFTSDIGVTIEGVNINNGLINGIIPDISEVVQLLDNATTAVDITNTATLGSYVLIVDAVQAASGASSYLRQSGGAYAVFAAASSGTGGAMNRLVGTKGNSNERLDITFATGEKIRLKHAPSKTGGTGALVPYRVKIQRVA